MFLRTQHRPNLPSSIRHRQLHSLHRTFLSSALSHSTASLRFFSSIAITNFLTPYCHCEERSAESPALGRNVAISFLRKRKSIIHHSQYDIRTTQYEFITGKTEFGKKQIGQDSKDFIIEVSPPLRGLFQSYSSTGSSTGSSHPKDANASSSFSILFSNASFDCSSCCIAE